jgi:hypothetical protein
MEERVAQFQAAAEARLPPAKLAKEVATLQRFLHRNQDHRFTEREKAKLFTAIQAHYANPAASSGAPKLGRAVAAEAPATALHAAAAVAAARTDAADADAEGSGNGPLVLGLIEDALKMPFTVFSTAQKLQLLKWLDTLQGAAGGGRGTAAAALAVIRLSVIDIGADGYLTLIDDDGVTRSDVSVAPNSAPAKGIGAALARGDDVTVAVRGTEIQSWQVEPVG